MPACGWHVSLSSWLRDYPYIPLGGNRGGAFRTQANLMITMLLGGLWHGAAWTFVLWGGWHGLALSVQRIVEPARAAFGRSAPWAGWVATQLMVLVGWVLFRATSVGEAGTILGRIGSLSDGVAWHPPAVMLAVACVAAAHAVAASGHLRFLEIPREARWAPLLLMLLLVACIAFHPRGFQPFIYFQF